MNIGAGLKRISAAFFGICFLLMFLLVNAGRLEEFTFYFAAGLGGICFACHALVCWIINGFFGRKQ